MTVANGDWAPQIATTLLSVVDNSTATALELYVGAISIEPTDRERIQRSVPDHPITWIDVPEEWLDSLPKGYVHRTQLGRLHALESLSERVERAIYIDADMLVTGDIVGLWNVDLDGHVLGAARCQWGLWMGRGQRQTFEELGLDGNLKYAQTGMMLVDLVKWRESSMLKRCEQYLFRFGTQVRLGDQEAINAVIDDDWLELPIRWNIYADPSIGEPELIRCAFSRDALIEASERPGIMHFCGPHKPWDWSDPKRDSLTAVDEWERTAMRTSYADWYAAQREQGLIERARIRSRRRSPFRRIRRAAGVLLRG
jgi:lipopolysaccharide biosynthesis glycosyltransferase